MRNILFTALLALAAIIAPEQAHANYTYETAEGRSITLPFDAIHSIAELDLGGDGTSELLVGSPAGFVGMVHLVRLDGSIINSWLAYDKNFRGGVHVVSADLDGDGLPEIITAPAGGGSAHVRIFDGFGSPKISPGFFAADTSYRGGARVGATRSANSGQWLITTATYEGDAAIMREFTAGGAEVASYPAPQDDASSSENHFRISIRQNSAPETLTLPKTTKSIERLGKVIIIDTSEQTLSYYQDGYRINTHPSSTGMRGYETPLGEYSINNKSELAYSRRYGLYMPFWMSFIGGLYGIHELPYWPSGYREGEDHLGTAVSHGCVRLGMGAAEELFEWATIGTTVIVQK
ncbi:MAG: L,D-transpeptidase family protein [Patescibacteria group bacterium]|nr:L,D-transpeptidase family protein [Patescibacteria group bacterium]